MSDGAGLPSGRLTRALLDVLLTELAEPGRLRRGRSYAVQGAVVDLVVEPGVVRAAVQGSRARPYEVTIAVAPAVAGQGWKRVVPQAHELDAVCTCPDDEAPCKHAIAVLVELAARVEHDTSLLVRWRSGAPRDTGREPDGASPVGAAALDPDRRAAVAAFLGVGLDRPLPAPPALLRTPDPAVRWDEPWTSMLASALAALRGEPLP